MRMKRVYEVCQPRSEVLKGELTEDIFAAELTPVLEGKAPPVYADAETFFANTFPTTGLKTLIHEVFLRLSGRGGNPLIRLETAFGGGKTHALIALYHLARDADKAPKELVGARRAVKQPIRVAAIVGRDFDVGGGDREGRQVFTLWGELAWQLGGHQAYELVAEGDRQGIAPSSEVLRQVLGEGPVLIMIDELGHYIRRAQGKNLAGKGTWADQVPPFLQSLAAAASIQPQAVVVFTLTGMEDAYAEENEKIRQALDEVRKVAARQELTLQPTRDEEMAHVVVQRLFAEVKKEAASETAQAYCRYYREAEEKQGAGLPERALRPAFRTEIERTYPFHPEFMRILTTKTASIPKFQRTRGALRLLARVVRSVWESREPDAWLIHPFHLDFADEETRMDLSSRLGAEHAEFGPPIEADIYHEEGHSHAQELDQQWQERGKPPLASRLARTIYLHSLAHARAGKAEVPDLILACAQPGLDPELLRKALQELEQTCWYLASDERSYWFTKEAQLNKIWDEQREQISVVEAKGEIRKRLKSIYQGSYLTPVFESERPEDVDDTGDRLKLCVMDFDAFTFTENDKVPPSVRRIYERTGTQEAYRRYKNTLLFLLADAKEKDQMIVEARSYLALQRIINMPEIFSQLSPIGQNKAQQQAEKEEVELRVAITRAYRHLLVPNPEAATDESGLQHIKLEVQEVARVEEEAKPGRGGGQEKVILEALARANKLLQADGSCPAPDFVWERAWPHGQETLTGDELVKAFRSEPRLPMLLTPHLLRATVVQGVVEGKWCYFDGHCLRTKQTGAPAEADIRLDAQHELWTEREARHRGYCLKCGKKPCCCIPAPQVCPQCGKSYSECQCPSCPRCGRLPWKCTCPPDETREVFESSPTLPKKAFAEMLDWAKENNITALQWIEVECYDRPQELQDVWRGFINLVKLEQLLVKFDASLQLPPLSQMEVTAKAHRGCLACNYEGLGNYFQRVYEFFHGIVQMAEDMTFTASFKADFTKPMALLARELEDLQKHLEDFAVSRIVLRAKSASEARPGETSK